MAVKPMSRVLPVVLAFAIGGAVVPMSVAAAAPDPAETTVIAVRACFAAMQDPYRLGDDVLRELEVRQEAWREVASGTVSGATDEQRWTATDAQVSALKVALSWMTTDSVQELADLHDDDRRSAEDDLVWTVTNLRDRQLDEVLGQRLDDRTAMIARLREEAARDQRDNTAATPAQTEPSVRSRASVRSAEPAAAVQPDPDGGAVRAEGDNRPDVAVEALARFQRRLTVAIRSTPDTTQKDLEELRNAGSVHDLGAVGDLLEWTQQQGDRGAELLRSWDDSGAAYAAALRSILAGDAAADTYPGVLDGCVRDLQTTAGDDGLDEERARELAVEDIARRLERDGTIRTVSESTTGSAHLRACTAAILDRSREIGLDERGIAAVEETDTVQAWDDAWNERFAGRDIDPDDLPRFAAEFWDAHLGDEVFRTQLEHIQGTSSSAISDLTVRCAKVLMEQANTGSSVSSRSLSRMAAGVVDEWIAAAPGEDPTPTEEPSTEPTVEPTVAPTAEPTATPTVAPTVEPTATPTVAPTVEPTATPTVAPTVEPTATPTVEPTTTTTDVPTTEPTVAPTAEPTSAPTATPTVAPTAEPTVEPTTAPTVQPTVAPTTAPTLAPTTAPTVAPTVAPTTEPTAEPAGAPTTAPTVAPTTAPTVAPTVAPTSAPTSSPTNAPTTSPTVEPTVEPTVAPTVAPTAEPASAPPFMVTTQPDGPPFVPVAASTIEPSVDLATAPTVDAIVAEPAVADQIPVVDAPAPVTDAPATDAPATGAPAAVRPAAPVVVPVAARPADPAEAADAGTTVVPVPATHRAGHAVRTTAEPTASTTPPAVAPTIAPRITRAVAPAQVPGLPLGLIGGIAIATALAAVGGTSLFRARFPRR